ncbi:MAG: LapD/MoxY N-terminal periplasmic domain-containing protein [Pseudomonadota bacterium]
MSLIKQLWIGIIVMLMLAMGGSFGISLLSAKQYLEEQLHLKNVDNASSLALSFSQMEKDLVTLQLLISAQFDTGHYEYIVLTDPDNKILIERRYYSEKNNAKSPDVPIWFTKLVNLGAVPGVAQVQDGWQQYGTLTVKSQSHYATQALWNSTTQLMGWFLIAALLSGALGSVFLKFISEPLEVVIKQVEAISERRFITSDEPKTKEFQRLVRAMNMLSNSVKIMLEKETRQLELLRRESHLDELTELPNRRHFLNLFDSFLKREDGSSSGVIAIARVANLAELNNQIGRAATDQALLQIAGVLHQFVERYPGSYAGRLNGSDFIAVICTNPSAETIGIEFSKQLNAQLELQNLLMLQLPVAVCTFMGGAKRKELLHKLDGALAQAELKGNRALITLNDNYPLAHRNLNEWREVINSALTENQLQLGEFPVKTAEGELLHYEAPVRLLLDEQWQPAGYFMPWAARLGIIPAIDLAVIKATLDKLKVTDACIAINISAEALCNAAFREQALKLIAEFLPKMHQLWIDFPEPCALRHMAELRSFTSSLRSVGCHVGLKHAGIEFTKIRELQDSGFHYLKIDSALIHDLDINADNQIFLQALCKIGHSLGMVMIAEGVSTEAEKEKIIKLSVDALTGPWI